MVKKMNYSVVIQWSDEDQVYVVTLPEWGCHTHGATYVEAAKAAEEVLEMLVEGEEEAGRPLPSGHGFMFPGPSGYTYEFNKDVVTPNAPKIAAKKNHPKLCGSAKKFRRSIA